MEIYKITNLVNNKIYIGKDTSSNPKYFGSGKLIKRAIKKYGIVNFKKDVIDRAENNEILCEKEIYWIAFYNSTDPKIGYNIRLGGEGIAQGTILTEEHKKNIGRAVKERWKDPIKREEYIKALRIANTEEVRKKISKSNTGKKHPHTEETKELFSEQRKGRDAGEKNPMYGTSFYKKWIEKYGKEEADKMKKDLFEKRDSRPKEGLIEKYGEEGGNKKWDERNEKISKNATKRYKERGDIRKGISLKEKMILKYGLEETNRRLEAREKKRIESRIKNRNRL